MLFYAHSGLRYLVLLAGIAAVVYLVIGIARGTDFDKLAKILSGAYVGLLDVQVLLGILLWFSIPTYGALYGHMVMMLLAATAGHMTNIVNKRREQPSWSVALAGVVISLILIVGGIMSIGRPLIGSGGLGV